MKKNLEIVLWVALAAAAGYAVWTYFPRPDMKSLAGMKSSAADITPSLGSHDLPIPDFSSHIETVKKVVEV